MKLLGPATLAAATLTALLAGSPAAAPPTRDHKAGAAALQGGARSVDELIALLLRALREKNRDALHELRVTEKEYRDVILPGSVKPGEPPRQYASGFADFLWDSLNTKESHGELALVRSYGGQPLILREKSFARGERAYAGYTAHSLLDLKLKDDQGKELLLEMGSIAQVGDRYKFISFMRD